MTTESSRAGSRAGEVWTSPFPSRTLPTSCAAPGSASPPPRLAEITPLADRAAAVARVTDLSLAPPATGAPIGGGWVENQWEAWYRLCWWWMERMRTSPVPLVEKMVLFWHNHFVSGQDKLYDMGLLYTQNQLFRQHALGDYHALVQGMAIDPAMLWYLDNAENVAGREQENFAREVMELFTMGQGNYTEADVITMARAWTGHNVSDDRRSYQFRSSRHDTGLKELFGGPPTNWDGPATLTEILRGSRAVPASRFITAKLFSYLAYPVPVTDPLVATLADGFRANNLSILWLVREILGSEAFWSPAARYALVRNPTEWFVAGMEAVGLPPSVCHPEWWMEGTGPAALLPTERRRLEAEQLLDLHRVRVGPDRAGARTSAGRPTTPGSSPASRANRPRRSPPQAFERFGIVDPSPTTRAALEAWVTRAKAEGHSWSIAPNLVLLLLASPDFQLA